MIFHNIYSITIDKFGLMFDFPSEVKRFNIWLPKKWLNKANQRLIKAYNELTNKSKVDSILDDQYHAANISIRIQLYYTLLEAIKNGMFTEIPKDILKLYKEYFKKDFEPQDVQRIYNEIQKLDARLKGISTRLKAPTNETDFNEITANIENILGYKIGFEKLYKMPYYMELANKKLKPKE